MHEGAYSYYGLYAEASL